MFHGQQLFFFSFFFSFLYLFLYMDAIFRLSGGQRKLSAPLWGWPISCDLLLIVSCDDRGPIKCVQSKKKKARRHLSPPSLQCLNITRERVSADFFEPHRSNLPSHTKDFFSFSLFLFFLLVCFGILFPSVFRGRFYPGSHFASSSSPFEPMRCVCPPFRVCVYLRDRPSSVPLLPLLLGRSL